MLRLSVPPHEATATTALPVTAAVPIILPFVQPESDDDPVWEAVVAANPNIAAACLRGRDVDRLAAVKHLINLLRAESAAYDEPGEPPPMNPCDFADGEVPLPGTPEKVALMVWRRRAGFRVFEDHEADNEYFARLIRVLRNGAIQALRTVGEADHRFDEDDDHPGDVPTWQQDLQAWRQKQNKKVA